MDSKSNELLWGDISRGRLEKPKQRRVVCAALRAANGDVLIGIRHYSKDMHDQISMRLDNNQFEHLLGENQGFADQYGNYMTRKEAYKVAEAAGQILYPEACIGKKLYSEALY